MSVTSPNNSISVNCNAPDLELQGYIVECDANNITITDPQGQVTVCPIGGGGGAGTTSSVSYIGAGVYNHNDGNGNITPIETTSVLERSESAEFVIITNPTTADTNILPVSLSVTNPSSTRSMNLMTTFTGASIFWENKNPTVSVGDAGANYTAGGTSLVTSGVYSVAVNGISSNGVDTVESSIQTYIDVRVLAPSQTITFTAAVDVLAASNMTRLIVQQHSIVSHGTLI